MSTVQNCLELSPPDNGDVFYNSTEPGSVATYTCYGRYTMHRGDAKRVCSWRGQWSGRAPVCRDETQSIVGELP